MTKILRKMLRLLPRDMWGRLTGVALVIACAALFDAVGIAIILPFLQMFSGSGAPGGTAGELVRRVGEIVPGDPRTAFGAVVVLAFSVGVMLRLAALHFIFAFSNQVAHRLSSRLFALYLEQDYEWLLRRNSSDLARNVLQEVRNVVDGILLPILRILAGLTSLLLVTLLLVIVNPLVSLMALLVIGGGYVLFTAGVRASLRHWAAARFSANQKRYRICQEAFSSLKEIKAMGCEGPYVRSFVAPSASLSFVSARSSFWAETPRFFLEALIVSFVVVFLLALGARGNVDLSDLAPALGTFAFGAIKIIPAAQEVYRSISAIRFNLQSLDTVYTDFTQARADNPAAGGERPGEPVRLAKKIAFEQVSFSYADGRNAVNDISLTIPQGSIVALVGSTGAGKSTLADLLLGLIFPSTGQIRIDGTPLDRHSLQAWRKGVGYVPQSINLFEGTVAQNIAAYEKGQDPDPDRVRKAARLAAIADFIENDLADGYETLIGDGNVQFSGGQTQRLGIARALYLSPQVLIFDEATSALDPVTERSIISLLTGLHNGRTIIMIAHRLSTVRNCDRIFLLEKGRLVAEGTYDELVTTNENFRRMAQS